MDPFYYLCFVFVYHSVLSVSRSLVATGWERYDHYALFCVVFSVRLSLSHMVSRVRCDI